MLKGIYQVLGAGFLEPLRTLDFVGFQEPVLDGTLNLKKFPELVSWNPKF
jgi:hypothetical protein